MNYADFENTKLQRKREDEVRRQAEARRLASRMAEENRQAQIRKAKELKIAEENRQALLKRKALAESKLKERDIQLKRQQAELAKVSGRYNMMRKLGMDYSNYGRDKDRIAVLQPRIQKILDNMSYWKKYANLI